MSTFHNGTLRTMKANYTIDAGDLRVIRPLVTCREALFKEFSDKNSLPIIPDNCPACFSAPCFK
jgi:tRNA(Ile)-lysidine synthase TilS/MesJ